MPATIMLITVLFIAVVGYAYFSIQDRKEKKRMSSFSVD